MVHQHYVRSLVLLPLSCFFKNSLSELVLPLETPFSITEMSKFSRLRRPFPPKMSAHYVTIQPIQITLDLLARRLKGGIFLRDSTDSEQFNTVYSILGAPQDTETRFFRRLRRRKLEISFCPDHLRNRRFCPDHLRSQKTPPTPRGGRRVLNHRFLT